MTVKNFKIQAMGDSERESKISKKILNLKRNLIAKEKKRKHFNLEKENIIETLSDFAINLKKDAEELKKAICTSNNKGKEQRHSLFLLKDKLNSAVITNKKLICREIVLETIHKTQLKSIEKKSNDKRNSANKILKKSNEKLQREINLKNKYYEEKTIQNKLQMRSLTQDIKNAKITIKSLQNELSNRNEKHSEEEINAMKSKIELLKRTIKEQKQKAFVNAKEINQLKQNLIETERETKRKNKQLFILSKSVEEGKERVTERMNERFRREQERVDEIIRLHREETTEYEHIIRKRDENIKELYQKIASQDETNRKMAQNLLDLSRNDPNHKAKLELEESKMEIMKLKSRLSNIKEYRDGTPESISCALQKGFRLEKEFSLVKQKNQSLKREMELKERTVSTLQNRLAEADNSLSLLKRENEQRTAFYRSVTHSILEHFKKSFDSLDQKAKVSGFKAMYEMMVKCENSDLATPRLKKIVERFGNRSKSET